MTVTAVAAKPRRRAPSGNEPDPPPDPDVTVTVSRVTPTGTSALNPGAAWIQETLINRNATAVSNALTIAGDSQRFMIQHTINSFGAANTLWSDPSQPYSSMSWATLDRQISDAETAGIEPVFIFGLAQQWMRHQQDVQTSRPANAQIDNFAECCKRIVRRVSEHHGLTGAKYVYWNEFKGYFSTANNRWDYELYTSHYNTIAAAIVEQDATALLGGPYPPVAPNGTPANANEREFNVIGPYGQIDGRDLKTIEYWLANADKTDFIVLDGRPSPRDGTNPGTPMWDRMQLYQDVDDWIRDDLGSNLPIMWSEWYAGKATPTDAEIPEVISRYSVGLYYHLLGNSAYTAIWKPEDDGKPRERASTLWTTTTSGGGQARPFAAVQQIWCERFPEGTDYYEGVSSDIRVKAVSNATHTVLVNGDSFSKDVLVNETLTTLAGYETKVITA
jgi:hypothetical protein